MTTTYLVVVRVDCGIEVSKRIPRTRSLDKYTDKRILQQYKDAVVIYKMVGESVCESVLKKEVVL